MNKGSLAIALFLFVFAGATAQAAEYGPQDHGGADWTLGTGDVIYGLHENVRNLTITGGATVSVKPFETAIAGSGLVEIHAFSVEMSAATLDATGAGHAGGAGGGGGGGGGSFQGGGGAGPGTPTRNGGTGLNGAAGTTSNFGAAGGGGGLGGNGAGPNAGTAGPGGNPVLLGNGQNGSPGTDGSYSATPDTSTDELLNIGSGGGGGGGGAGGDWGNSFGGGGGGGGAAGGSGGGFIKIYSDRQIRAVNARILARGATGGNGGNGQNENTSIFVGSIGGGGGGGGSASNLAGTSAGGPGGGGQFNGGGGGGGGKGGGGGILLHSPVAMELTGATVDARGGNDQTANGGTIKIFHAWADPTTDATLVAAARIYKDGALSPVSGVPPTAWMLYE